MNWGRVKTVFIIVFLVSDLFLLGILINSDWRQKNISKQIMQSTVQILKNNSVNIDTAIIPDEVDSVPYAEVENIITDYENFARLLLGDIFSISSENTYENDMGIVSFSGNSFCFNSKITNEAETAITEKNAEDIAKKYLSQIGFDLKNAKISSVGTDNGFEVVLENKINKLAVFNSKVTVSVIGGRVASISGIWFNRIDSDDADSSLKGISSMLIDATQNFDTSAGVVTIISLELGYNIPEYNTSYQKSAVLVPVWQICDTRENVYYIDARNPQ